ncbi:YitT family protein [Anaeromicropila populeti]|uniref:Uncharacterized membrane-anchored protein YitT, contains DUF161 and DUF2179 domains n=1 Tax=Anaeromicropila populeti TaxID=37658 RepID=A0A1I6IE79_9FIRM|nr:YitT family protein [Anaeromicropila populeti]SFR65065.1 Uncharacterized membrane-anchored protein YitT, contains DUF161 and DUF2179 domains [Anaeromicropila populeti]
MSKILLSQQFNWKNIGLIIIGTFLMGATVNIIYEPMNMVPGGVSGLAIVIKQISEGILPGGVPVWLTTAVINVPLFLFAYKIKGKKFFAKTLFATVSYTFALAVVPSYSIESMDNLLAALFGGVLSGTGLGLVFYTGTSTGGSDLLGAILNHYVHRYSVAQLLLLVDGAIITAGAFVFGAGKAMYAVIAAYLTSRIMEGILEGLKFAKLAYIISDNHDALSYAIMKKMGRGVTLIRAEGGYTKREKNMLMCVVSKKQIIKLKEIVAAEDEKAFLIVTDAREVMGEGFIKYKQ